MEVEGAKKPMGKSRWWQMGKQAKLVWMGREEEVDRTLAPAWHMAPGASWLRRPAAFPYTEVSKLVLWYSSVEEELLFLPFYRQRKTLRKVSRIFKRAKTAVLACIRPSVWNQRSPPANNPSWTQHVSVSSAWGLTPCRAVRSAFGVWSLCGMIIALLSPCSDTWKKYVLTPSVPCHSLPVPSGPEAYSPNPSPADRRKE